MKIISQSVVDERRGGLVHGHTIHSRDNGSTWYSDVWDRWVKMDPSSADTASKLWFSKPAIQIFREHAKIETTPDRARDFENAIDANTDLWYYIISATDPRAGDEALKWVLGALAAEVKVRKLDFLDIPRIISATMLRLFTLALLDGRINRTFSKQIFAELMERNNPVGEQACAEVLEELINDPRFKAVNDDDLVLAIDRIIAENPDQFKKACENPKLVQWFVGQGMKAMQGRASAPKIIEIMNERIGAHG